MTTIDLTRGVYRRIYSGFVDGERINSISVPAEALFWRVHAIADDFGVFPAGGLYVKNHAAPRRKTWSAALVERFLEELKTALLVTFFRVGRERYGSINGFLELQPAGRSGRRIKRFPGLDHSNAVLEESGGGEWTPGELVPPNPITITIPKTIPAPQVAAARRSAEPRPAWSPNSGWSNIEPHRERWQGTYPACDIEHCLRRMDDWLRANPAKAHKSNWAGFIARWLAKEQDRGGATANGRLPGAALLPAAARRDAQSEREFTEVINVPRI